MLAPVYLLDGLSGNILEDTDYIIAQKDGYYGRDCSRYQQECPASFFQVRICLFLEELKWICKYSDIAPEKACL